MARSPSSAPRDPRWLPQSTTRASNETEHSDGVAEGEYSDRFAEAEHSDGVAEANHSDKFADTIQRLVRHLPDSSLAVDAQGAGVGPS